MRSSYIYTRTFIVLTVLICSRVTSAQQVSFPLHTGDEWAYDKWIGNAPSHVLGDTVMPNSVSYRTVAVPSDSIFWIYFRQDKNKIYRYDTYNRQEILFFDFDVAPDSVFSMFPYGTGQGSIKLLSASIDTLFGTPRSCWDFYCDFLHQVIDEEVIYHVTDTLGVTATYNVNGPGGKITGARINGITYGTIVGVEPSRNTLRAFSFHLGRPYPNPFNPSTTIRFYLSQTANATVKVFDVLGRQVATVSKGLLQPGDHVLSWEASGLPSGLYFIVAQAGESVQSRTVILLK